MITLHEARDDHYAWMLEGDDQVVLDGLRLPKGEIDSPAIVTLLRGVAASHRESGLCGMWLIVHGGVVVGSCGYMRPVAAGTAEIGYGVAPGWQRRGFASQAVGALIAHAKSGGLNCLLANTATANIPSQRVLAHHGFTQFGTLMDAEDGELLRWRLEIG
jgi:RimJ/RimL family protein N-acetyltransferase